MPIPHPTAQRQLPAVDPARSPLAPLETVEKAFTPPALHGLLRVFMPGAGSPRANRLAGIQKSMLIELRQVTSSLQHDELAREITQADQPEQLWKLRGALSSAIGAMHGELVARQKMTEISFMFSGLLRRPSSDHSDGMDEPVLHYQARSRDTQAHP